jgi:hypothetical protein
MIDNRPIRSNGSLESTAFSSVEAAWFWTVGALQARNEGRKGRQPSVIRPCDPDDILRCLDQLYRNRRIDLSHARVLRRWGDQRMAPTPRPAAGGDSRLWQEAMERLEPMLRQRGIVQ